MNSNAYNPNDMSSLMVARQGVIDNTSRQWRFKLCDWCSDLNTCCDAYWCPCCNVARQWDAVEGRIDSNNGWVCFLNTCLGCTYFANIWLRCKVVTRYNLTESSCTSCINASCCPICSMVQTYRELNYRGLYPGGTSWCRPLPQQSQVIISPTPIIMGNAMSPSQTPGYVPVGAVIGTTPMASSPAYRTTRGNATSQPQPYMC